MKRHILELHKNDKRVADSEKTVTDKAKGWDPVHLYHYSPAFELHICIPNMHFQVKLNSPREGKMLVLLLMHSHACCPSYWSVCPGRHEYPQAIVPSHHPLISWKLLITKVEFQGWAWSFSPAIPWIVSSKFSLVVPSGDFEGKCHFPSKSALHCPLYKNLLWTNIHSK